MRLSKEITFEAAHYLPRYHGKCEELHGHTYRLRVTISGQPDHDGMILDFRSVKQLLKERVYARCDHRLLNDFIPNPSAENLAWWVWVQLEDVLQLESVEVYETCDSRVELTRADVTALRAADAVPTGWQPTAAEKELRESAAWGCPRCRGGEQACA